MNCVVSLGLTLMCSTVGPSGAEAELLQVQFLLILHVCPLLP